MTTSEIISTIAVILSFVGVLSSFVFSYKKADISTIMKGTGLSKATVSNRIKGLEEKSYIIRKRQGKTTFFEFNEDLTEESA